MGFRQFMLPLTIAFAVGNATRPDNNWQEWTSTVPAAVTFTVTERSTETRYTTRTAYITVTGPTITQTDYKSIISVQSITQFNTITVIEVPKPITQVETITVTKAPEAITQVSTVTQVNTVPKTVISSNIVEVTTTKTVTEPTTVFIQSVATIVNTVSKPITITSLGAVTQTVSVSTTCPTPTSGITTCPTRIINPTYTPATPLPSTYLWGCPPGKLCHPKRENCNFEQGLPADTYVCAPEECLPVADLPPLQPFDKNATIINENCAFITPVDDYFNLNPLLFGLDYSIFNIYGQPKCTSTSPVTVTTVTATCAPAPTWSAWSSPTTKNSWVNWRVTSTASSTPAVTKRAELIDRKRQAIELPKACFSVCNAAMMVWQSIGKPDDGCDAFASAFASVTSCTENFQYDPIESVVTTMTEPIKQCLKGQVKREADE